MGIEVVNNDVLKWAKEYKGARFHALLCDPPYELGFMGKDWDRSGIAFNPETWAALSEHMLPGAFGMAFASSRGWHRMAVAIEEAGLRIHPSIFGWVFGSGFPKATRIDTQIDKKAGMEQKIIGEYSAAHQSNSVNWSGKDRRGGKGSGFGPTAKISEPATPLAKAWAGHRYGLQALKPALEPIIVWQKPYDGKPVDSIVETGAGALNIDGARISVNQNELIEQSGETEDTTCHPGWGLQHRSMFHTDKPVERGGPSNPLGRWPAGFYVDEEAAERLGEQSGVRPSCTSPSKATPEGKIFGGKRSQGNLPMDTGTAARFFLNVDWQLEQSDPVLYCPKASRKERDAGLENTELIDMELISWGNEVQKARLLVDMEQSAPRVIGASMIPGNAAIEWSTISFGRIILGLSQAGCKFTIKTETSSITTSPTLRWLTQYITSEFTLGVNYEMVSGTSNAQSVDNGSQSIKSIGISLPRDGRNMDDAVPATLRSLFKNGASAKIESAGMRRSSHPTVKPLKLTQWLATLLLPPDECAPRRILVPFAGSGSEMIGAALAGWEDIIGIEMEKEYCDIADARIKYWTNKDKQIAMNL